MSKILDILKNMLKIGRRGLKEEMEQGAWNAPLSNSLETNEDTISNAFGHSGDLVLRRLRLGSAHKHEILLVYIDGLVDNNLISTAVIKGILSSSKRVSLGSPIDFLQEQMILAGSVKRVSDLMEVLGGISTGHCVVLVEDYCEALVCGVQGAEHRGIQEPTTEVVVRGPKEGFTEVLRINTAMLRRKIGSPRLWFEEREVGTISKTKVSIAYIKGVASQSIVEEVRRRIERITTDTINESGQLEEYIEDAPLSPFPTLIRTERPDRVAGELMEGRVAILTNGTPFALILPATFSMYLTASEDYYERYTVGSALRFLRLITFFLSLTFPSIYVAITTFHQEMLPTSLVLAIAAQREGVPFPAVVEALLMEVAFEILREAGVRLPMVIGPAISIVGVLILGQAAVEASLVSSAMIIVVAVTAIASFTTPIYSLGISVRLLRFPLIILASTLGLFGVFVGLFMLLIHLCSLRSFGVPYLEPLAPVVFSDFKDVMIRAPWWAMDTRPGLIWTERPTLQEKQLKPRPPKAPRKRRKGE
ncbi:MAG: spore germination protein [Limnochordia bacterium]|nr:spore germination protein [Limnochordia bacterium]MDD2628873.1 spore germination protein [Limnochordia bacterium]MDD4516996.1 spore germination protein [Limnochordia bacterium]